MSSILSLPHLRCVWALKERWSSQKQDRQTYDWERSLGWPSQVRHSHVGTSGSYAQVSLSQEHTREEETGQRYVK